MQEPEKRGDQKFGHFTICQGLTEQVTQNDIIENLKLIKFPYLNSDDEDPQFLVSLRLQVGKNSSSEEYLGLSDSVQTGI